jgi:hypothetical protein
MDTNPRKDVCGRPKTSTGRLAEALLNLPDGERFGAAKAVLDAILRGERVRHV